MQSNQTLAQYIAIIIPEIKSTLLQLYPLTKNYPMSLLTIGSKKLINFQLEALLTVPNLAKIIIIVSEEDKILKDYIQFQFLTTYKNYAYPIQFSEMKDTSNSFLCLKKTLQNLKHAYKGYILLHADTISSVPLNDFVAFHESKNSDLSLLGKAKRQLGQQQKKLPQAQVQTDIDNVLIGENGQCIFLDMMEQIDNEGIKIDVSIFKKIRKGSFRRMVDSKLYIFTSKITQIIMNLSEDQIYQIKPLLIKFIVQNQTNKRLLKLCSQNNLTPLRIYVNFHQQDTYIKKISSKKVYQLLNFDSILRGPKQKDILMPTLFSDRLDQRKQYKNNCIVVENVTIGASARLRRACIGSGCKIGKNVELLNCIILENVQISDNCKIVESVIGSGSSIGQGSTIKNNYLEAYSHIPDGSKLQ